MSDKPQITLYTAATPNGFKASIVLEELGISYEVRSISLQKNEQKEPWFLEINPNGRIPAITDNNPPDGKGPLHIFESGAILEYLVATYDKDHKISYPANSREHWQTLSWLHFQMGGVGPMQGQANHFFRYAPEKIPYGVKRYQDESRRLYSVINDHLKKHGTDFIVGDKPTIADFATIGWFIAHPWAGVDLDGLDHVKAWGERMEAREAVQKGITVPGGGKDLKALLKDPKAAEEEAKKAQAWIMQNQEKK